MPQADLDTGTPKHAGAQTKRGTENGHFFSCCLMIIIMISGEAGPNAKSSPEAARSLGTVLAAGNLSPTISYIEFATLTILFFMPSCVREAGRGV